MNNKIYDEETCSRCDEIIYGIFDEKELYKHKIGKIRCPKCGHINPPCNVCEDPTACDTPDCPWFNAKVQDGLSVVATVGELKRMLARLPDSAAFNITDMDGEPIAFNVSIHAEADGYDASSMGCEIILPYYGVTRCDKEEV